MRARIALGPLAALLVASALAPLPMSAQQSQELVVVTGRVVDLTTGAPLSGAFIEPARPYRGTLTDETGIFSLSLPPEQDHALHIERLGYAPVDFVLAAGEMGMSLRIEMDPEAITLEGIEVFSESLSEQFERRRNAAVGVIQAYRTEAILELEAYDGFEVFDRLFRQGRPCTGTAGWCAVTPRGEQRIGACIDGKPAWAGVEELRDYAPEDFYLIEVDQFGTFVRAYTWQWVRSGFRQATTQMDPIVRVNPNAPRAAAFATFQEAFQACG